jgi:STE24 endopeptidase
MRNSSRTRVSRRTSGFLYWTRRHERRAVALRSRTIRLTLTPKSFRMPFDPAAETARYIDSLGAPALQKAAAYTAGEHWLILWGLVVTAVVTWIIVKLGLLERVEARFARRGPNLRAFLVGLVFFFVSALISLPWTLYSGWWREREYGRTSQPLADALGQGALSTVISSIVLAAFFVVVYALIRRTGRRWWLWSGGLTAVGVAILLLLAPILLEPLFNDFKPIPEGPVRTAVAELAQRAGVPPTRIFVYDGSRQSNNFTANAGGVGPTARIAISDVAFKGASLDEVKAVTGHEIGHYVLHHSWRAVATLSLLAMLAFFVADRSYAGFARLFGSRAPLESPASLAVVLFMVSALGVVATPVTNTLTRIDESEADQYSLENVNLPDALASALVKTAEYRYPRPSRLQEIVFYSHPSVERRVLRAMQWKATHPPVAGAVAPAP